MKNGDIDRPQLHYWNTPSWSDRPLGVEPRAVEEAKNKLTFLRFSVLN
jgi:hypothetical protein